MTNGSGNGNNQLNTVIGLVFDDYSNSFVMANYNGHSVVRWRLGDRQWSLIAGMPGTLGNTSSLLQRPIGLAMDPMGNIYCADAWNHRVQLFFNGQSEGITLAGITGLSGLSSNQFNLPYWVQLDSQLNLYVADTGNGRIQKFLRY